jgi:hypothetical protein
MNVDKSQLRPAGKGFVLASIGDGLPTMRRLVEAYTGRDKKKYIKLDGKITPLLPSHMFMSGN